MQAAGFSAPRGATLRAADRYLMPEERTVITTRQHPAILRGPALLVLAALAGAALVTAQSATGGLIVTACVNPANHVHGVMLW